MRVFHSLKNFSNSPLSVKIDTPDYGESAGQYRYLMCDLIGKILKDCRQAREVFDNMTKIHERSSAIINAYISVDAIRNTFADTDVKSTYDNLWLDLIRSNALQKAEILDSVILRLESALKAWSAAPKQSFQVIEHTDEYVKIKPMFTFAED